MENFMEQESICEQILKLTNKPDNYLMCRAINIYDNRYRVNIYTKTNVEGIEGKKIGASYFIKYENDRVVLL
jgi:hypothetical protein